MIQITRPGESWGAVPYLSDSMASTLSHLLWRDGSQLGPALSMWDKWGLPALREWFYLPALHEWFSFKADLEDRGDKFPEA